MIDSGMDTAVDAAETGLGGSGVVAVEGTYHAGEHIRGHSDPIVVAEEAGRHCGAGTADGAVGAWVGGSAAVASRGVQFGSAVTAGFSASASRVAVIGLQR
jgi:hypothetical protein